MKKYFLIVIGFFFIGCAKEDLGNVRQVQFKSQDRSMPVLVLDMPSNQSVFHNGDVILINGMASDNDIRKEKIEIVDIRSGEVYFKEAWRHDGDNEVTFNYRWPVKVDVGTTAMITVSFADGNNNVTTIVRTVRLMHPR